MTPSRPLSDSSAVDHLAASLASLCLLSIAALHVGWAHGRSWPLRDRETLARNVLGVESSSGPRRPDPRATPGIAACYAVAAALTTAAALVDGHPRSRPALRQRALRTVVAVLGARGALGVAGRTHVVVPFATGATFTRLDRRVYGPLCLSLAVLASRGLAHTAPSRG